MFVKTKTACVTCPLLFVRGSVRAPIGAKNARKMCEKESMRKTLSVGSFGFAFFDGICSMIRKAASRDKHEIRRAACCAQATGDFGKRRARATNFASNARRRRDNLNF